MLSPRHLRLPGTSQALRLISKHRHPISTPIRASSSSSSSSSAAQTPANEYYTIGRHIFDGCTSAEARTLGEQLARVVSAGGPGVKALRQAAAAAASTDKEILVGRGVTRIRSLGGEDIFDAENEGIIKPTAIIRHADEAFQEYIRQEAQQAGLDLQTLQIRQHSIQTPSIAGGPPAKGIIHYTVNGPRLLPIDIHTSLSLSTSSAGDDIIIGEVQILSGGGKNENCGSCRIEYTLHHMNKDKGVVEPLSARQVLKI